MKRICRAATKSIDIWFLVIRESYRANESLRNTWNSSETPPKKCLLLIFEVAFFISFCWVCATMKFLCFMLAGMLCMHYVLLWVSWTWNDTFFSYWFFFVLFFVSIWNFAFAFVFTGHVWLLSRLQGVADSSKDAHFNISIWINYLMDYRPSPDWTVERNKLNLITKGDTNWHLL